MYLYNLKNTYSDLVLVDAGRKNEEGRIGFHILFGNKAGTLVFCTPQYMKATFKRISKKDVF